MKKMFENTSHELKLFVNGWYFFLTKKIQKYGILFEKNKDIVVDILIARRGTYQRPFLHMSLGLLFVVGAISAPIITNSETGLDQDFASPSSVVFALDMSEYGVETQKSEKPRDQVEDYLVQKGDTLSTIAEKYGVSVDSIKWVNDIKRDSLTIGQTIKIPPVTGVVHKVREGETVYSIAKKYKTDAQKIVNYPFNDFSDLDTFALNVGQTLVVPEGVVADAPVAKPPLAKLPPVLMGGTGQFQWPTAGIITQYPIWYHMAVDIANSSSPGIVAADSGTVTVVEFLKYGYGHHVLVDHGNGYATLYGHMSEIYVKPGEGVKRGSLIGRMGSTGRSTGTHLHFEIRKGGILVNPLPFLQ